MPFVIKLTSVLIKRYMFRHLRVNVRRECIKRMAVL